MFKIYCSGAKTRPFDMENNLQNAKKELEKAVGLGAHMIVFPQGFLCGVQLGILNDADYLFRYYNELCADLAAAVAERGISVLADKLTKDGFENVFYTQGKAFGADAFSVDGFKFMSFNSLEKFKENQHNLDCDCVVLNASQPVVAGQRLLLQNYMAAVHTSTSVDLVLCLGGLGLTSHPNVFLPAFGCFTKQNTAFTRTLGEFLQSERTACLEKHSVSPAAAFFAPSLDFDISFNQNPLVPKQLCEEAYCLDLFHLQSVALADRLDNIGCKNAVVAVSGGLDSALAFMVTINAFDFLGLDHSGIHPISMPGFGTSSTTKSLAQQLIEAAGFEFKVIDITKAAHQALSDIGHDGTTPDVTFENVQARMRTLNSLNLANALNGIMIGTGDLSEEALGFSTYGGDHLASYNVNSSVSKTVIRTMLPYVLRLDNMKNLSQPVNQILNIPVSPELVPHGGEILQKTEEILAPYKLIDFFIYCFCTAKLSPIEMAQRASCVFEGEFSAQYLRDKARLFCRRFISGQFKRSCAPEGAAVTHVHLNGEQKSIASDAKMGLFDHFLGK